MKRFTAYILSIICVFILAGCAGNTDTQDKQSENAGWNGRPVSAYIGDDVTKVIIEHGLMGQLTKWSIEGNDIRPLQAWANGLKYEIAEFEKGNTPADTEGGETYSFALTGGVYPGFVYYKYGSEKAYLQIEGYWYVVNNPSEPPVEDP